MMFGDRVQETTSTTGTGDLTMTGPTPGHLSVATEIGEGVTFPYLIEDGAAWEHATGILTGTTLTRTTVKSSTGSPLALSGSAVVSNDVPAGWFNSPSFSEYDLGDISGAITLDKANGPAQVGNLTGSATIDLATPSAPTTVHLRLTGDHAIDWVGVTWIGGVAPDFAGADRMISFRYQGGSWIADGGKL
jgi:hypothetical protein